ncbi:MAG: hypothetical protein HYY13_02455 [Nitrospirae bacterium]|nr:hypothetical protein [Nitrospirota bacterium]
MKGTILFSSVCGPFERILGRYAATDQMAFRLTRSQGLFTLYEHTHFSALHILAQNLSRPSVVLEYPTLDQFRTEVAKDYEWVAISFKVWDLDRVLEMCDIVRNTSPATRIVLGGYGAICMPHAVADGRWNGKYDAICTGEGIAFLRRLLDEPPNGPLRYRLPKIGSTLPWLSARPVGTIGIVLSGLGCTDRCPFCVTSAMFHGQYVEVMSAEDIYTILRGYWDCSPLTNSATIYDENFLDHKEKVESLGRLVRADGRHGLRAINYFAFGSVSALSRYDPDELLLNGLDTVWVGVESKFSPLAKRRGTSIEETFRTLHRAGIKTVGSWILGEDYQTPDNVQEDEDFFLSLEATFQQLAVLSVTPGTALWRKMHSLGRIPQPLPWHEYHLFGQTVTFANFTYADMLDRLDAMYRRIYREQGAALVKVLETNLNGLDWCRRSSNRLLREHKAVFFKNRCESYFPLLKTAREHAPSLAVRSRMEQIEERYRELLGPIPSHLAGMADLILRKADEEALRRGPVCRPECHSGPDTGRGDAERPTREEPFRRYTYAGVTDRSPRKPYRVEYPAGDRFLRSAAAS